VATTQYYTATTLDGYIADELCQSTTDPSSWAIVSEWLTPEHFHAWERGVEHRALAGPLVACTTDRRSAPYLVHHRTTAPSRTEGRS
jgi:heme oxygenase (mycobilin-producing)